MNEKLEILKAWANDMRAIAGEWDGKSEGGTKDRAESAEEALKIIDTLADLFAYLNY